MVLTQKYQNLDNLINLQIINIFQKLFQLYVKKTLIISI